LTADGDGAVFWPAVLPGVALRAGELPAGRRPPSQHSRKPRQPRPARQSRYPGGSRRINAEDFASAETSGSYRVQGSPRRQ